MYDGTVTSLLSPHHLFMNSYVWTTFSMALYGYTLNTAAG